MMNWLRALRGALMVFLVYAIFPHWPIWRTMVVALLISTILILTRLTWDD